MPQIMTDYTLYGAPISLFTGKLRAYLNYKGIPFTEKLSTLAVYRKIIVPNTGVRFIPVLKTPDGRYLQDTAEIIDTLEAEHSGRPVLPDKPRQLLVSKLFELYGDEWLLLPAMHYRWNRGQELAQQDQLFAEFGRIILPGWPGFIQRLFGRRAGSRFRDFVPRLGISEATIPAIEQWYESDFLRVLDAHFAHHDYLLGAAASIGDFGLMGPLYAHLYLDPYPGKLMREKAPHVALWVERMNTWQPAVGQWLPADQIPESLSPILTLMFSEFFPVLRSTVDKLARWRVQHDKEPIPRFIGEHDFSLGRTSGRRVITPFSQWKLQRVLAVYQGLDVENRSEVDRFLEPLGGKRALAISIDHPLRRQNNHLVWES